MRNELSAYYDTLPVNVDAVLCKLDEMYESCSSLNPCLLKARVHSVIAENCAVHVFRTFPFYFEIESGRRFNNWGFGPLGSYLENKTASRWIEPYRESISQDVADGVFWGWNPIGMDHHCPGYDNIFHLGLSGLDAVAREKLSAETDEGKRAFYEAVLESNRALRLVMNKFADEAERLLSGETDPSVRKNLERIATAAREVPDRPPRTFYEALETILFIREEYGTFEGMGMSTFGQLDRLLQPFYEADLAAGRITRGEAKELIDALLDYTESRFKTRFERVETSTTIIIGGCDAEGNIIFNDITRMVLECVIEHRYVGTKINARISAAHPAEYFALLSRVLLAEVPVLAIQNDEVHIAGRVRQGFDRRDARLYVSGGCHETVMANTEVNTRADSWISLPGLLLRMLREGGEYASFDEFYQSYLAYVYAYYASVVERKNRYEAFWPLCSPAPMYSASLTGCLESGRDLTAGGAKYNDTTLSLFGTATIIDSLYAIRAVVYEQKKCTLAELTAIVESDFENQEALRRYIVDKLPKHGTNDAVLNEFSRVFLHDLSGIAGQKNARGGKYLPGFYPHDIFIAVGSKTGATPDGRHAGYYLSRGVSPSEFISVKSPLDIINSVRAIDFTEYTESFATELTLPRMERDGENLLTAIIRAFLEAEGSTLQINLLDRDQLVEAKAHPEQHQDIIVRICGYSEKFVSLSEKQQDEVISRAIR